MAVDKDIMALAIVKIFRERKEESLLGLLAVAIIGPLIYYRAPAFLSTPDILYVKAKLMQVLKGRIFADPITGYDTMHPPWYHLVLAPFKIIGLNIDLILAAVTILNVVLIVYFTFKLVETVFDRKTGFYTALMIPFIIEYMGCRNILLATSFYFSLPFYLAGLWVYFKSENSIRLSVIAAVLWGLAFIISPVYVFLIGLTFVYELIVKRRYRRFLVMAGCFALAIIPFLVQAIYIYAEGLWGSRVFALWRGVPELEWWGHLITEFLSPTINDLISIPAALHLIMLIAALVLILKAKKVHWFVPLSLLTYFLTFYHFSDQYAIRIQVIFSVFLVATLVYGLKSLHINRYLWAIPIAAISVFGLYQNYSLTDAFIEKERAGYEIYFETGKEFWQVMGEYLDEDRYIFCNKDVYLKYIMPFFPAYSLGAYKTMDYFQLKAEIADTLEHDYQWVIRSTDYAHIDSISTKYSIETAVATRAEIGVPLLETLVRYWKPVYQGKYFVILKKPAA